MGDLAEGDTPVTSHSTSSAELNPFEIGTGNWTTAERAAREIIRKVQPNSISEERRKRVVGYVQRLIGTCLGAEVFAYGSVPLKTYLPDGDIDLTTFGVANVEDTFADDVLAILREEEKNAFTEFVVKDVQLVRAEVKLIKCIVQDTVIDVSFNQLGGLCTLCFLEQVDCMIGRDHLFKRSIILIKAWCYYESRILGAHHGLISTYALETMVLYIFHLFHSKLDGPLAVLFKFLDYFSKFDWDTYCISLNGPVRLSSLPDIVVEMPEDSDQELLLPGDFLSFCANMFSVPYTGVEKEFQLKHLNIFDPLKEINNLGRSVSRGNFYRIRSAFSYGAQKLAKIICQPVDSVANELRLFFSNTVGRHGGRYRPEIDLISFSTRDIHPKSSSQDLPKETKQSSNTNRAARTSDLLKKNQNQSKSGFSYGSTKPKYSNLRMESNEGSSNRAEMAGPLNYSDLGGDLEGYMWCLNFGKRCYEHGLGVMPSLPPVLDPPNGPWDSVLHFEPNGFSYGHHPNGFHPVPNLCSVQPVMLPTITYGWMELPKPRGTGTYFPNTILQNQLPQDFRPSTAMKGKKKGNMHERGNRTASQHPSRNNSSIQPKGKGQIVNLEPVYTMVETCWGQKTIPSSPGIQKEQDCRILVAPSYLLKDDKDFPPLPA